MNYYDRIIKYNYRTLYRMIKLYGVFSNEKLSPLGTQLIWSHYLQLLSIDNISKIYYYIQISIS